MQQTISQPDLADQLEAAERQRLDKEHEQRNKEQVAARKDYLALLGRCFAPKPDDKEKLQKALAVLGLPASHFIARVHAKRDIAAAESRKVPQEKRDALHAKAAANVTKLRELEQSLHTFKSITMPAELKAANDLTEQHRLAEQTVNRLRLEYPEIDGQWPERNAQPATVTGHVGSLGPLLPGELRMIA